MQDQGNLHQTFHPLQDLLEEAKLSAPREPPAALPPHVTVAKNFQSKAGQLPDVGDKKIQQQIQVDGLREQLEVQEQKLQTLLDRCAAVPV